MKDSIIHIKAPHEIHIAAKALALQYNTSMNQYLINLIKQAMDDNGMKAAQVRQGIKVARQLMKDGVDIPKMADNVLKSSKQAQKVVKDTGVCEHGFGIGFCKIDKCNRKYHLKGAI